MQKSLITSSSEQERLDIKYPELLIILLEETLTDSFKPTFQSLSLYLHKVAVLAQNPNNLNKLKKKVPSVLGDQGFDQARRLEDSFKRGLQLNTQNNLSQVIQDHCRSEQEKDPQVVILGALTKDEQKNIESEIKDHSKKIRYFSGQDQTSRNAFLQYIQEGYTKEKMMEKMIKQVQNHPDASLTLDRIISPPDQAHETNITDPHQAALTLVRAIPEHVDTLCLTGFFRTYRIVEPQDIETILQAVPQTVKRVDISNDPEACRVVLNRKLRSFPPDQSWITTDCPCERGGGFSFLSQSEIQQFETLISNLQEQTDKEQTDKEQTNQETLTIPFNSQNQVYNQDSWELNQKKSQHTIAELFKKVPKTIHTLVLPNALVPGENVKKQWEHLTHAFSALPNTVHTIELASCIDGVSYADLQDLFNYCVSHQKSLTIDSDSLRKQLRDQMKQVLLIKPQENQPTLEDAEAFFIENGHSLLNIRFALHKGLLTPLLEDPHSDITFQHQLTQIAQRSLKNEEFVEIVHRDSREQKQTILKQEQKINKLKKQILDMNRGMSEEQAFKSETPCPPHRGDEGFAVSKESFQRSISAPAPSNPASKPETLKFSLLKTLIQKSSLEAEMGLTGIEERSLARNSEFLVSKIHKKDKDIMHLQAQNDHLQAQNNHLKKIISNIISNTISNIRQIDTIETASELESQVARSQKELEENKLLSEESRTNLSGSKSQVSQLEEISNDPGKSKLARAVSSSSDSAEQLLRNMYFASLFNQAQAKKPDSSTPESQNSEETEQTVSQRFEALDQRNPNAIGSRTVFPSQFFGDSAAKDSDQKKEAVFEAQRPDYKFKP